MKQTESMQATLAPTPPRQTEKSTAKSKNVAKEFKVPLGGMASRTLETLCRRFHVEPEYVQQAIVENFLADACADATLAPCVADEAREIARTGGVPASFWEGKPELVTPGFTGETLNGREGK